MPTSIHIQYRFFTGAIPFLILLLIVIILPIVYLVNKNKENKKNNTKPVDLKQAYAEKAEVLRKKYIMEVRNLEKKITNNEISVRDGYQGLSSIIREFVKEKTDIDVTNKTLAEIRGLNMVPLERLVEEYYEFEFSNNLKDSNEGISEAISKTIRTIQEWY